MLQVTKFLCFGSLMCVNSPLKQKNYYLSSSQAYRKKNFNHSIVNLFLTVYLIFRSFQDIPLHNLAGILHQSRHSKEAIQILNSAIHFAPQEPKHYFAMGNIYASIRDFNNSIAYYEKFLELEPNDKEVASNRHAVLCDYKLETALTAFQT